MSLTDFYNNTVGEIEKALQKAVLCVYDARGLKKSQMNQSEGRIQKAAMALEKAYRTGGRTALETEAAGGRYKLFRIQFNPDEISLTSSAGWDSGSSEKKEEALPRLAKNIVSIPLIFEDIEESDAFIWDRQQTLFEKAYTPEELYKVYKGSIRECSVKRQVDGLMSLLSHEATRNVVFCWGDISLAGMLESEQVEYNMFNRYGNPIMAKVTLRILLDCKNADSDGKYWKDAFEAMFKVKIHKLREECDLPWQYSAMTH